MNEKAKVHQAAKAYDKTLKEPVRALAAMRLFYDTGETLALIAAFDLIIQHSMALHEGEEKISIATVDLKIPEWLIDGIFKELFNSFKKGRKIGLGQLPTTTKRTHANQKHLARYVAVEGLMDSGGTNGKGLKIGEAVARAKTENFEAFKNVTEDAIRKSHAKVSKEIADPDSFWKYFPQSSRLKKLMDELADSNDT